MSDKAFNRNALIVGAAVLIGALLWFAAHKSAQAADQTLPAETATPAGSPAFQTTGYQSPGLGPFNFPISVNGNNAPQSVGSLVAGNCSCGCDGGGTNLNFGVPGLQSVMDQLAASASAANTAALNAAYAAMGTPEAVYVSDASPTTFSGGNPFNTYADYAHTSTFSTNPSTAWWAQ